MRQDKMKTRGKRILSFTLAALLALGAAPAAEAAVRQNSGAKAPAASHSDDTVTRYDPRQSAPVKTFAAHVDEGNWRFFAEGTPIVVRENGWITSVYDTGGNLLSGATDLFYYDIYGGWESGDHNGDTSVTVESGTLWSVYGGSLAGTITGSTVVRIEGGEADSVFGGSGGEAAPLGPDDPPAAPAAIAGNTSVFISGGNISGTVYGGGNNAPVSGRASVAVTNSNLYGTVVFGGGFGADVAGDTGVLVENSEIRIVIGGGYDSDVAGDTYVTVKNSEIERVYGGGENYANVEGTANVSVVNSAVDTVYGGGNNYGSVGAARLTIGEDASESGTYGFAAAGGISSMVEEDTRLEIYGGTFGRCVIAGGDDYSNETEGLVGGNTELMIHGGTFHDAVYGGGWFAAVEGDTGITVEDGMFHGAVLGGGRRGTVEGGTEMTIRGGVFEQPICAGGDADIAVTGSTALTVDGGTFLWVFGGGWQADVNGGTGVTVNGGTFTTLSGGGCGLGGINGNTSVTVNGGSFGWIYGGGLGDFDTGTGGAVTGNTSVIINDCGNADYVIGGGSENGAIVGGTANIKLKGGTVTAVYGGGWSGDVIGAAVVDVWPEATINRVAAGAADENLATVGAGSKVNYWQYLTYDANGGGGGVARGEAIVGTAAAAAASAGMTPPDGKVFKEWNTGADGSGDTYAPGASVIVPENGLTLYAVWEDTPDTLVSGITVSGAGGTAAISVKGASLQMEALVSPADATDSSVTWSVIDGPGSATISASGLLKAVTDGTVTVRATANDGSGIYGECEIAISGQRVSVTSVTVGGGAEISETGGTLNLTANVLPADADEAGVRWSVANKDASLRTARAAIDQSGVLTALRNGVVVVTASATDGSGVSGTLEVTVSGQYDRNDLSKMKAFLGSTAQPLPAFSPVSLFAAGGTNADILGWDVNNPASWDDKSSPGVVWIELDGLYYLKSVSLTGTGVTGHLNLAGCAALEEIAVSGNKLTSVDVSNTPNLARLYASGNQISSFRAENAPELSLINLSGNPDAPRDAVRGALEAGCLVYTENGANMSLIWNAEGDELLVRSAGGGYITGAAGVTVEGGAYYWLFVYPEPGYEFVRFENSDGITITPELEPEYTFYGEKTTGGQRMTVTAVFRREGNNPPVNPPEVPPYIPAFTVPASSGGTILHIPAGFGTATGSVTLNPGSADTETLIRNALNSGTFPAVLFDLSGIEGAKSVKFDAALANKFGEAGVSVALKFPAGEIALTPETLEQLSGGTVRIEMSQAQDLTKMQAAQTKEYEMVYDIDAFIGNEKVELPMTVRLPYTLKDGEDPAAVRVWHLDDDGALTKLDSTYDGETVTLRAVSRQSCYAVGYDPAALWVNVFSDISESAWYYDAVAYVNHYGLFVGNGGKFMPDDSMTRAMFVTVLWNLEGKPAPDGSASFGDVPGGTWYHDAAVWAAENGIVAGTGGGLYAPGKTISRQEMALMLLNYANFKGYAIPDNREAPDYTDTAQIAVWAESAVRELSEAGVMGGNNNAFMPQKAACRAEAAQLIKNFLRLIAGGV